jgi:hypothetical protein
MGFYAAGLDVMGDAITSVAVKAKLHSADPGSAGTLNTTSAAAQSITWTSVNGSLNLSAAAPFTGGAASGAVTWVTLWDSALATCYGKFQITSGDLAFNASGAYTLNNIAVTGT